MRFGRGVGRSLLRLRRSSKGGAALELAVVFPLLLLLIVGVVDYGRMYFTSVTVANAARAGAEYGVQGGIQSMDTVAQKTIAKSDGAEAAGTLWIKPRVYCQCGGTANACASVCSGGAAPDVFIEITATDTISTLLPYPGLPTRIPIVRKATFRSQ
jgi:Flp pilus assembly protein TadG